MNIMKSLLVFSIISIIVCSCSTSVVTKNVDLEAETLEVIVGNTCGDTLLFKSTKMVQLETTENSMLKEISRILADDHKLFVLDKRLNAVFVFEDTGKHLYTIKRIGAGPEEYRLLHDICLDTDNKKIILYVESPFKLQTYNYSGEFLEERKLKASSDMAKEMAFQDATLIALNFENNQTNCYINSIDPKSLDNNCWFEKAVITDVHIYPYGRLLTKNTDLSFTKRFDNTIYKIAGNSIKAKYYIDFKESNFPDSYLKGDVAPEELTGICRKDDYVYGIVNVHENNNYLAFGTNKPGFYIYSKKEKELKKYSFLMNTQYGFYVSEMLNMDYGNNQIAFIVSPEYLHGVKEYNPSANGDFLELISKVDQEANDLLMICDFK